MSLAVAGDSAGGGLALALMAALRDLGEPLPAAAVVMSPWTDLTLRRSRSLRPSTWPAPTPRRHSCRRCSQRWPGFRHC
jgi:acetyl esterase/lipase